MSSLKLYNSDAGPLKLEYDPRPRDVETENLITNRPMYRRDFRYHGYPEESFFRPKPRNKRPLSDEEKMLREIEESEKPSLPHNQNRIEDHRQHYDSKYYYKPSSHHQGPPNPHHMNQQQPSSDNTYLDISAKNNFMEKSPFQVEKLKRERRDAEEDVARFKAEQARKLREAQEEKRKEYERVTKYYIWDSFNQGHGAPKDGSDHRKQKFTEEDFSSKEQQPYKDTQARKGQLLGGAGAPLQTNSGTPQTHIKIHPSIHFQNKENHPPAALTEQLKNSQHGPEKEQYGRELLRQLQERELSEQEKKIQELKREIEMLKGGDPYGKPGGGAPQKSQSGHKVMTHLKSYHSKQPAELNRIQNRASFTERTESDTYKPWGRGYGQIPRDIDGNPVGRGFCNCQFYYDEEDKQSQCTCDDANQFRNRAVKQHEANHFRNGTVEQHEANQFRNRAVKQHKENNQFRNGAVTQHDPYQSQPPHGDPPSPRYRDQDACYEQDPRNQEQSYPRSLNNCVPEQQAGGYDQTGINDRISLNVEDAAEDSSAEGTSSQESVEASKRLYIPSVRFADERPPAAQDDRNLPDADNCVPVYDEEGRIIGYVQKNSSVDGEKGVYPTPRRYRYNDDVSDEPYFPFGRPGAGAPILDVDGNIMTSIKNKLERNTSSAEERRKARAARMYFQELKHAEKEHKRVRQEMENEVRGPIGEFASVIKEGQVGKPKRDPITGTLLNQHLGSSDISKQKMNSQYKDEEEMRIYHDDLTRQADDRHRMRELSRLKDKQMSKQHYDVMGDYWGKFGGGAPKDPLVRKKAALEETLFSPGRPVEPKRNELHEPVADKVIPHYVRSIVPSTHKNSYDYSKDKNYSFGAPYATLG